jgi:hypothetical protein
MSEHQLRQHQQSAPDGKIDFIATHAYFAPFRDKYPGAEAICFHIEQKMLNILETIFLIPAQPPKKEH